MGFLIKLARKNIKDIEVFLEAAVDKIIEGKIIAFPTDSIYGIGGDPLNLKLIERLYEIKFRERTKGLLLLVLDIEEALRIVEFNDKARILAEKFWPGQLTLILRRKVPNIVPIEVSAFQNTIGLRVPDHPIILTILKILKERGHFGGIIGTSANYSGELPSVCGDEIAKKFLRPIDLIIDGGPAASDIPTTIVDCTTDELKFLRIGKITQEEVLNALSNKGE